MKLKMEHLRHRLRAAALVRSRVLRNLELRKFAESSRRHFHGDVRYDLANVTCGLVSRVDSRDDTELLKRICAAYNKTVQRRATALPIYRPTEWWQQIRQQSLGPVMRLLQTRDIDALGRMYRNFFREPCASGLIGWPWGLSRANLLGEMKEKHQHFFLGDALHNIDYWAKETGGCFRMSDLAGPETGNPFGVSIDGTLVRIGTPYQHYCAQRIRRCLDSNAGVVAEIGGGYGEMAYYLLRGAPGIKYLDFDLPESIALTSYYLLKAFPQLNFLLYGEKELTAQELASADVVLMPLFEMEKVPSESVDVTFSSHAISDTSPEAKRCCLKVIADFTKKYFITIGQQEAADSMGEALNGSDLLRLEEMKPSGWNNHRYPEAREVECLYGIARSEYAGADSEDACR
jgi:hypothetical protein